MLSVMAFGGCSVSEETPTLSPEPVTVTITDEAGNVVSGVPCPPLRIASLNPSVTEALYALGAGDKILCRSSDALFPPEVLALPEVGISKDINIEALLAMGPDVVIMRTRTDPALVEKIQAADIPVLLFWSIDMTEILPMIEKMGVMLDEPEKATDFRQYIEGYLAQIDTVVAGLDEAEKPDVFYQTMGQMYKTTAGESSGNKRLLRAGCINIAGDLPGKAPTISPEYVVEQNPDIIIHSLSVKGTWSPDAAVVQAKHAEIMALPELQNINAVTNDEVHVIANRLVTGPRTIIGLLYYAKWFHPDEFAGIDPAAVHAEMCLKYWNLELEGTWTYPE